GLARLLQRRGPGAARRLPAERGGGAEHARAELRRRDGGALERAAAVAGDLQAGQAGTARRCGDRSDPCHRIASGRGRDARPGREFSRRSWLDLSGQRFSSQRSLGSGGRAINDSAVTRAPETKLRGKWLMKARQTYAGARVTDIDAFRVVCPGWRCAAGSSW